MNETRLCSSSVYTSEAENACLLIDFIIFTFIFGAQTKWIYQHIIASQRINPRFKQTATGRSFVMLALSALSMTMLYIASIIVPGECAVHAFQVEDNPVCGFDEDGGQSTCLSVRSIFITAGKTVGYGGLIVGLLEIILHVPPDSRFISISVVTKIANLYQTNGAQGVVKDCARHFAA